jgi:hypothetical protein
MHWQQDVGWFSQQLLALNAGGEEAMAQHALSRPSFLS